MYSGKTGKTGKTGLLLGFYKNEPVVAELMWSCLSKIYGGGPALNLKNQKAKTIKSIEMKCVNNIILNSSDK